MITKPSVIQKKSEKINKPPTVLKKINSQTKKLGIGVFLIFLPLFLFSQNNFKLNEKNYVKIKNKWNLFDKKNSTYYPIEGGLTIKFNDISNNQRKKIEKENNLIFLRKALTGWCDYQIPTSKNIFEIANSLLNLKNVSKVEIPVKGTYIQTPNDTYQYDQWYLNKINAYQTWDINTGDPNIIVAIIDSGTDWSHEDLGFGSDSYQNIYLNSGEDAWTDPNDPSTGNGADDDGNGYIDDWKGWNFDLNNNNSKGTYYHGTHVAGIVSAKTNNNTGVAGIAGGWNSEGSKILICGVGQTAPNSSVLDDAIIYAAENGGKVLQLSLNVASSDAINDAIEYAYSNYNLTIVCAAGNSDFNVSFPANNIKVLAIGATNQTDHRASFSNYGNDLFIAAPGVDIRNLDLNNGYNTGDGTSFSAPIVSGVISLMYSVNPCLTENQIENILKQTSDKVGGYNYNSDPEDPGHSQELGYGLVDAYAAVQMADAMNSEDLDLYVKDNVQDLGLEPNNSTNIFWRSPDIWVRNQDDGMTNHENQNPIYDPNSPNFVYVKVTNKSCVDFLNFNNSKLKLHWAKANTGYGWPGLWNGAFTNPLLGELLASKSIPIIPVGESRIMKFEWYPANPDDYDGIISNPWHFCLLARIIAPNDPMTFPEISGVNLSKRNNNIASKNVTVMNVSELSGRQPIAAVGIGNIGLNQSKTFDFELKTPNLVGDGIWKEAEVMVTLDPITWKKWDIGGRQSEYIRVLDDKKNQLIVENNNAKLLNITYDAHEWGTLSLSVNFLTKEVTDKEVFNYELIQSETSSQEIVGGESYIFRKNPGRNLFDANGNQSSQNGNATMNAQTIGEPATYNWYDPSGNFIYSGQELSLNSEIYQEYKLEVIADSDGYKDYGTIELTPNPFYIESLSPNPASENVEVYYHIGNADSAYLMVTSINSGVSNNYILDDTESEISIDIADYTTGVYVIFLIRNGEIVDHKNLLKN